MAAFDDLFKHLQSLTTLKALIGTTEDLHLDCKTWPANDNDAQKVLAKALCGFANADGGVIVVGLEAKSGPNKDDPDVIQRALPVTDALAVKSRIENLVGQLVEPPPEGVQVEPVFEIPGQPAGFVLIAVPATEGLPCRSRKDWKFHQRISAGTYPMEYFQIADMFGKRRRPLLKIYLEDGETTRMQDIADRSFTVGIENRGRGVAKFPNICFPMVPGININHFGIDGNGGFGLPRRPTEPELIMFGGGVDHVIYPGMTLKIAVLTQRERRINGRSVFDEFTLKAELAADDCPSVKDSATLPERSL